MPGLVTPFNHLGHATQLLYGQSALVPDQDTEHYLVAFYDKLKAAAGLFFWHPDLQGAANNEDLL